MTSPIRFSAWILATFAIALVVRAQNPPGEVETKVGPSRGTIIAVGGGARSDVLARFIQAAGGADALILVIPTASTPMDADPVVVGASDPGALFRAAGAKNVLVLHTSDRDVANSDRFIEPINRARGVWFGGGMPERIMDAYAGTKAEAAFRSVLARGGVVGGTSAGAVVMAGDFAAGAMDLSTGQRPMRTGFGFLRGMAVHPHARTPQPERWMLTRNDLLRIAADEPTAWVVQGDNAEIIGRGRAFVYGESTAESTSFITLRPGDQYNLSTRVVRRAIESSPLTERFVDSLFAEFVNPAEAAVLVAQNGRVLVEKLYNFKDQPVGATSPTFTLGGLADMFNAIAVQSLVTEGKLSLDDPLPNGNDGNSVTIRQYFMRQATLPDSNRKLAQLIAKNIDVEIPQGILDGFRWGTTHGWFVRQRLLLTVGAADGTTGEFRGSVDELFNWEYMLENPRLFTEAPRTFDLAAPMKVPRVGGNPPDVTFGWHRSTTRGLTRFSLFGVDKGRRHAFVRIPERGISVIILTNKDDADVQTIAERIVDRLVSLP